MKFIRFTRQSGRVLAIAAVAGAAVSLAQVGQANAATPEKIHFCNQGKGFSAYLRFVDRGGRTSSLVRPGKCINLSLTGSGAERVQVFAVDAAGNGTSYLGQTGVVDPRGANINTHGIHGYTARFTAN